VSHGTSAVTHLSPVLNVPSNITSHIDLSINKRYIYIHTRIYTYIPFNAAGCPAQSAPHSYIKPSRRWLHYPLHIYLWRHYPPHIYLRTQPKKHHTRHTSLLPKTCAPKDVCASNPEHARHVTLTNAPWHTHPRGMSPHTSMSDEPWRRGVGVGLVPNWSCLGTRRAPFKWQPTSEFRRTAGHQPPRPP